MTVAGVQIRSETLDDIVAIDELTGDAFRPMRFSDGREADIVRALRVAGDLTLSLVAEDDVELIGHVAFSPVTIDGAHNGWFGLGPIAVKPGRQRQGVGSALIRRGLEILRARGAGGCALIGNPDIYRRVGFESHGRLRYGDLETRLVQHIAFRRPAPVGVLKFAAAFDA